MSMECDPGCRRITLGSVVRAAHVDDVIGTIYLPKPDLGGMNRARFRIPPSRADVHNQPVFQQVKSEHYQQLCRMGFAGTAWFRHQARSRTPDEQQLRNRPPTNY